VLVTERRDASRAAFQTLAKAKGAPELMIPAEVVAGEREPLANLGQELRDFSSFGQPGAPFLLERQFCCLPMFKIGR
jgi:hypothetical protein